MREIIEFFRLGNRHAVHHPRFFGKAPAATTAETGERKKAYEYWMNDMYLNYREPIAINSNPGMVFPPRKFTTILDVARFAARLIDAALDHKEILNRKALPVEKATSREAGQPLCMAQFYRILGASRLPGKKRDFHHVPASSSSHLPPPERLEWVLEATDHKRIEEAGLYLDNLVKDLDFQVFRYNGYGKEFMKSCKVSPDVYIQLALQLTYYRLYGKLTATYESASVRRFRMGRVDCIRSASPEALAWVKAMSQPKEDDTSNKKVTFHLVSDEKKILLWNEAVAAQTTEMVENILGQGIDLHILGLREAAKETSPTAASPLPKLFTDASYRLANKFLLSTSQVATSTNSFMGYGPVESDGYGASYNPKTDCIIFCLSAFWSSEVTSTSKYAQSLEESLNIMQSLLTRPST
ncbi:unnamed protein product [Diabrotica balteata]|uniref:Choline O-acetyltransferase n=1 Tax=Diabrotica balteata TaxID=107213 RepID=A0A9N9SQ58_DIABA|nr:unnamed protein product [Diabrotica balteata]